MHSFAPGTDDQGNILIPFTATSTEIPFSRWQMVSERIWESPGPVTIQSVIITHKGEIFVQYAKEINDEGEYPSEYERKVEISTRTNQTIQGESLVEKDEKRSYE